MGSLADVFAKPVRWEDVQRPEPKQPKPNPLEEKTKNPEAGSAEPEPELSLEDKYLRGLAKKSKEEEATQDENEAENEAGSREERTVFVGNVPTSCITDSDVYEKFKNLFTQCGDIVSVRFRSVAFSKPISRKIALQEKLLDPERDSANAYVVFASPDAAEDALRMNGHLFEEHHIRVDSVAHPAPHRRKSCVFVGNLPFKVSEETVYRHFQECGEIEYVRILRDSATNIGRGVAYVQFVHPPAVQLALLLDGKPLGTRKLRVSEVKAHPGKLKPERRAPAAEGMRASRTSTAAIHKRRRDAKRARKSNPKKK